MNLLFLTSTLPRYSGDSQAAFVLEQALAWTIKRPTDKVFILAPHDSAAARVEVIGTVEIHRFQYFAPAGLQKVAYPAILPNIKRNPALLGQLPLFLLAEYWAAWKLAQMKEIDLVYAHWVMPQGLVAYGLHGSLGIPYVLQNHSSDLCVFSRIGALGRAVARAILRNAQVAFCVNAVQKAYAADLFSGAERSMISDRITVMPMGVGVDPISVTPSDGMAPFRYRFGTISRLSQKKGIDRLIAAAELLASEGLRPPIGIAGNGECRSALEGLAERADVTFKGFLVGEEKARFFDETQFFVFPAVAAGSDVEGLPVSLLEALCCGKITIASRDTNIETLPEWEEISDMVLLLHDLGDIATLADAMRGLMQLPKEELVKRSTRLRRVMARYLWPELINGYISAIGRPYEGVRPAS